MHSFLISFSKKLKIPSWINLFYAYDRIKNKKRSHQQGKQCAMIHIMKDNEKSAKIENEKERATFRKMSIMMVSFVLLNSVLFHYFSMNASKCCAKKRKCIECSLCKHFCCCHGPPMKKHARVNKKENEVKSTQLWIYSCRIK